MAIYTWVGNIRKDDFTSRLLLDNGAELLIGEYADISQADLDQLSPYFIFVAGSQAVDISVFPYQRAGHGGAVLPPIIPLTVPRPGASAGQAIDAYNGLPISVGLESQPITAVAYGDSRFPESPTSITEGGITTTYTYNSDGTVATEVRNGVTRTFSYSAAGLLTGAAVS